MIDPSWSSVWPFWNSQASRNTDTRPSGYQRSTRSLTTSLHTTEPSCGSQTGPSDQVAPVASRRMTAPGRSSASNEGSSTTGAQPARRAPSATGWVYLIDTKYTVAPGLRHHRSTDRPMLGAEVPMGWYGTRLLPRLLDIGCGQRATGGLRSLACVGLAGSVLEIGFGSGHNVEHYPSSVERVTAVEPSDVAWRLATRRVSGATIPVEREALDAQDLPFEDGTFDACLSTWTLCSVPDAMVALAEVRRVLQPGGTLHYVEHGSAFDESVRRWQGRLEPLQRRLFGGCHLTRDISGLVAAAGFEVLELHRFYMDGSPRVTGATYLGVARA